MYLLVGNCGGKHCSLIDVYVFSIYFAVSCIPSPSDRSKFWTVVLG